MRGTTNIPAVCVLLRRDDKLLFLKQSNTGFQDGMYCLPAGHVEDGESFRQAAAREALEEVNAYIKPEDLRFVHVQQSHQGDNGIRIHVFFEANSWKGELQNMEPDKHAGMQWLPADDLPYEQIMPLIARGLQNIQHNKAYDEWGWQ